MNQTPPLVVLDTNVIISAWITPDGICSDLFKLTEEGILRLSLTSQVIDEYVRVLSRPALVALHGVAVDRIRFMIERVADFAVVVTTPSIDPVIAADPTDDVFLACAVKSRAEYLVSGDHHLLELGNHEGTVILRPHEMLAVVRTELES